MAKVSSTESALFVAGTASATRAEFQPKRSIARGRDTVWMTRLKQKRAGRRSSESVQSKAH